MLEKDIEEWLNKQVKQMGGLSYKFISPGLPGVPDRIYVMPDGEVWFVELKHEVGRLRNLQKWQREQLQNHGCNYRLVRGMDGAHEFVLELTGRMVEKNGVFRDAI